MTQRPYVLLSVAMSVDGCIDDATDQRLVLSTEADLDRVDEARAGCDAILVGASTIRRDNPRLLVNSEARRAARVARGLPAFPLKVTITAAGSLAATQRFFVTGGDKVVYCASPNVAAQVEVFADNETVAVVDGGDPVDLPGILGDLADRGVRRLMVEGGTTLHTQFLTAGLVDEIQLAVAPFFVGDPAAPRFVGPGSFPQNASHRMTLAETCQIDDLVLVRYLVSSEPETIRKS